MVAPFNETFAVPFQAIRLPVLQLGMACPAGDRSPPYSRAHPAIASNARAVLMAWRALTYDTRLGGYVVDIDKDRLADTPRYGADDDPFRDDEDGAQVDAYFRITPTS